MMESEEKDTYSCLCRRFICIVMIIRGLTLARVCDYGEFPHNLPCITSRCLPEPCGPLSVSLRPSPLGVASGAPSQSL